HGWPGQCALMADVFAHESPPVITPATIPAPPMPKPAPTSGDKRRVDAGGGGVTAGGATTSGVTPPGGSGATSTAPRPASPTVTSYRFSFAPGAAAVTTCLPGSTGRSLPRPAGPTGSPSTVTVVPEGAPRASETRREGAFSPRSVTSFRISARSASV